MNSRGKRILSLILEKDKPELGEPIKRKPECLVKEWLHSNNFNDLENGSIPVNKLNKIDVLPSSQNICDEPSSDSSRTHISDSCDKSSTNSIWTPVLTNLFDDKDLNEGQNYDNNCTENMILKNFTENNQEYGMNQSRNNIDKSDCSSESFVSKSIDDNKDEDFQIDIFDAESSSSSSQTLNTSDEILDYLEPNNNIMEITKVRSEINEKNKSNTNNIEQSLSETLKETKDKVKKCNRCRYCDDDILSKNFARHLQRKHIDNKEVEDIFKYPKNSKERKKALFLLKNDTNFALYINGTIRPNRQRAVDQNVTYYPCAYCKGLYNKEYLKRHAKVCIVQGPSSTNKNTKTYHRSNSQTVTACATDPTNVISKLNIKNEVFNIMRGDEISLVAKKDLLIVHFGESYLKSQKRERKEYSCSSRMRELAKLLIAYRNIMKDNNLAFKDILHPKHFDGVVSAARVTAGYDPVEKNFTAPSIAMHMGTYLKVICDELNHLILKQCRGFQCGSKEEAEEWRKNVKHFKQLVQARWNTEISSLAHKNLQTNRLKRPLLVPLVDDIKKFRDETLKIAHECEQKLTNAEDDKNTYRTLVECTLALLILFNRRRIGDVQYLKIQEYMVEQRSCFDDFKDTLTETEKMLTSKYKRIVNTGKGSRPVVILVPEVLTNLLNILLKYRAKYIPSENTYIFAIPGSKLKWGQGDVAIRRLTKRMALKYPMAISSNKLRKHIATVMQILNLSQDEAKQFSKFMGHTEKTHSEFYELPIDIYQTAKMSKILLMMEKGLPIEHKGKSLSEINLNPNLEYAELDEVVIHDGNQNKENTPKVVRNVTIDTDSTDEDLPLSEIANTLQKRRREQSDVIPPKKIVKKGWTTQEIVLLEKEFKTDIKNGTFPSGEKVRDFIKTTQIQRTVNVIKSKIQHLQKKYLCDKS